MNLGAGQPASLPYDIESQRWYSYHPMQFSSPMQQSPISSVCYHQPPSENYPPPHHFTQQNPYPPPLNITQLNSYPYPPPTMPNPYSAYAYQPQIIPTNQFVPPPHTTHEPAPNPQPCSVPLQLDRVTDSEVPIVDSSHSSFQISNARLDEFIESVSRLFDDCIAKCRKGIRLSEGSSPSILTHTTTLQSSPRVCSPLRLQPVTKSSSPLGDVQYLSVSISRIKQAHREAILATGGVKKRRHWKRNKLLMRNKSLLKSSIVPSPLNNTVLAHSNNISASSCFVSGMSTTASNFNFVDNGCDAIDFVFGDKLIGIGVTCDNEKRKSSYVSVQMQNRDDNEFSKLAVDSIKEDGHGLDLNVKGSECCALHLLDEMSQLNGRCSVGRIVAAVLSIRDKGGGLAHKPSKFVFRQDGNTLTLPIEPTLRCSPALVNCGVSVGRDKSKLMDETREYGVGTICYVVNVCNALSARVKYYTEGSKKIRHFALLLFFSGFDKKIRDKGSGDPLIMGGHFSMDNEFEGNLKLLLPNEESLGYVWRTLDEPHTKQQLGFKLNCKDVPLVSCVVSIFVMGETWRSLELLQNRNQMEQVYDKAIANAIIQLHLNEAIEVILSKGMRVCYKSTTFSYKGLSELASAKFDFCVILWAGLHGVGKTIVCVSQAYYLKEANENVFFCLYSMGGHQLQGLLKEDPRIILNPHMGVHLRALVLKPAFKYYICFSSPGGEFQVIYMPHSEMLIFLIIWTIETWSGSKEISKAMMDVYDAMVLDGVVSYCKDKNLWHMNTLEKIEVARMKKYGYMVITDEEAIININEVRAKMSCDERWLEKIGKEIVMIMANARLCIITYIKVINGVSKTLHLCEISNSKSASTLLRYHSSSTLSIVVALFYVALVMFVTALGEMKIIVKAQNVEVSNEDNKQVDIDLGLDEKKLSVAMILVACGPNQYYGSDDDYISERTLLLKHSPLSLVDEINNGPRDDVWCLRKSYMLAASVDYRTDAIERALNAIWIESSVAIDPWMFAIVLKGLRSSFAKEVHVSRRINAVDQFMETLDSATNDKACECGADPLFSILPLLIQLTFEDQAGHLLVKEVFQRHLSDYSSKLIENTVSNFETSQCVYGDQIIIQLLKNLSSNQLYQYVKPPTVSCLGTQSLIVIFNCFHKCISYFPFEYFNHLAKLGYVYIFLDIWVILCEIKYQGIIADTSNGYCLHLYVSIILLTMLEAGVLIYNIYLGWEVDFHDGIFGKMRYVASFLVSSYTHSGTLKHAYNIHKCVIFWASMINKDEMHGYGKERVKGLRDDVPLLEKTESSK